MAMERELVLDEDQEARIKAVLQLDERRPIPEAFLDVYKEMWLTLGQLGVHTMPNEVLAVLAVVVNRATRPAPESFLDVLDDSNVTYGTRVVAKFRKKWTLGRFVRLAQKTIIVQLDDDTAEERSIKPTQVRLATREDLNLVGEEYNGS